MYDSKHTTIGMQLASQEHVSSQTQHVKPDSDFLSKLRIKLKKKNHLKSWSYYPYSHALFNSNKYFVNL